MPRPLTCTNCGAPAAVVEDVLGLLDWGPAVVGDDGTVRPAKISPPPTVNVENSTPAGRPRACCTSCDHQWRLRRRFDPTALPATEETETR